MTRLRPARAAAAALAALAARGSAAEPAAGADGRAEVREGADAVFLGEVVRPEWDPLTAGRVARVRVERVWKRCGALGPVVEVDGTAQPAHLGRVLAVGQWVLFHASRLPAAEAGAPPRLASAGEAQADPRAAPPAAGALACAWE